MDSNNLLGRNAYAKHRGCSPNAVRKAELDGRIAEACIRDAAGVLVGIDARLADQLWAARTDPAMQRDRVRHGPAAGSKLAPVPVQTSAPAPDPELQEYRELAVGHESALLHLPAVLVRAGLAGEQVEQILAEIFAPARAELDRRKACAGALELLELSLENARDELAQPGTWTR